MALGFIARSAPKVGYWFSGAQYNFQQELHIALAENDKEASLDIGAKTLIDVSRKAGITRREGEAQKLAHEIISGQSVPGAIDGEGNENKITIAAVFEAKGFPKEVAEVVSTAIVIKSEKERAALQAGFQKEREQFQVQIAQKDAKHIEEINRMNVKHDGEMKNIRTKYDSELTTLRSQIDKMENKHARDIDSIKTEHKKDKEDLKKLICGMTTQRQNDQRDTGNPSAPPSPGNNGSAAARRGAGMRFP